METVNEQQVQQEVSPTSRPYSLTGFCIYVGASSNGGAPFVQNVEIRMMKIFGGHRTRGGNHRDAAV